jgi:hypothetical protein
MREEILKRAWNDELKSFTSAVSEGSNVDATSFFFCCFPKLGHCTCSAPGPRAFASTVRAIRAATQGTATGCTATSTPTTSVTPATAVHGLRVLVPSDALAALGRSRRGPACMFIRMSCMAANATYSGSCREDIDAAHRRALGQTFRQTYSHGRHFIHCAVRLSPRLGRRCCEPPSSTYRIESSVAAHDDMRRGGLALRVARSV